MADLADYWYEIPPGDEIRQGDILRDLVVIWLPRDLPASDELNPADDSFAVRLDSDRWDWIELPLLTLAPL